MWSAMEMEMEMQGDGVWEFPLATIAIIVGTCSYESVITHFQDHEQPKV